MDHTLKSGFFRVTVQNAVHCNAYYRAGNH